MEGISLTITRGLAGLIFPVSLVAIPLALVLVGKSLSKRSRGQSVGPSASAPANSGRERGSSALERISVSICVLVSMMGLIAFAINAFQGDPVHPLHFAGVFGLWLLIIAPALLWRSVWRIPAEGLATIALAVVTVLTGFSIGFALVPLLIAMTLLCIQQIRANNTPMQATS